MIFFIKSIWSTSLKYLSINSTCKSNQEFKYVPIHNKMPFQYLLVYAISNALFRNWKFFSEFLDKCSDIQMEGRKDFL